MSHITYIFAVIAVLYALGANAADSNYNSVRDKLPDVSILGGMTQSLPDCNYDKIIKLGSSLDVGVAMHDPVPPDSNAAVFTFRVFAIPTVQ